jgi:hypothetical protein
MKDIISFKETINKGLNNHLIYKKIEDIKKEIDEESQPTWKKG